MHFLHVFVLEPALPVSPIVASGPVARVRLVTLVRSLVSVYVGLAVGHVTTIRPKAAKQSLLSVKGLVALEPSHVMAGIVTAWPRALVPSDLDVLGGLVPIQRPLILELLAAVGLIAGKVVATAMHRLVSVEYCSAVRLEVTSRPSTVEGPVAQVDSVAVVHQTFSTAKHLFAPIGRTLVSNNRVVTKVDLQLTLSFVSSVTAIDSTNERPLIGVANHVKVESSLRGCDVLTVRVRAWDRFCLSVTMFGFFR